MGWKASAVNVQHIAQVAIRIEDFMVAVVEEVLYISFDV